MKLEKGIVVLFLKKVKHQVILTGGLSPEREQ